MDIKKVNSFWLYGDTYAVMDTFYTLWHIGKMADIISKCNRMNADKGLSFYAPFEVVKLTDGESKVFEETK